MPKTAELIIVKTPRAVWALHRAQERPNRLQNQHRAEIDGAIVMGASDEKERESMTQTKKNLNRRENREMARECAAPVTRVTTKLSTGKGAHVVVEKKTKLEANRTAGRPVTITR